MRKLSIAEKMEKVSLTQLLQGYSENFEIDVDDLWYMVDYDKNGILSKEECKDFVEELKTYTVAERGNNYDESKFDEMFDEFDEDQNGYIEKAEMAVLIKRVFRVKPSAKRRVEIKNKEYRTLSSYLQEYARYFSMDLDELWNQVDTDQNGLLDKKECKNFLSQLQKVSTPDRAQNYDEKNFEELFEKFDEDKNGFIEKSEMAVFIKQVFKVQ